MHVKSGNMERGTEPNLRVALGQGLGEWVAEQGHTSSLGTLCAEAAGQGSLCLVPEYGPAWESGLQRGGRALQGVQSGKER